MIKNKFVRFLSPLMSFVLVLATAGLFNVSVARAASLTLLSDTLTDETTAALTNNDILFTTSSTIPTSGTITLSFSAGTVTTISTSDVFLSVAGGGNLAVVGPADATHWGFIRTSATLITITAPSSGSTSSSAIEIKLLNNKFTNGAAGSTVLTITTTNAAFTALDTGTIAIPILSPTTTGDQVAVTATVNPTISFSLDSNSVDFGALTPGTGKWATSPSGSGGSGSDVAATNMTISTNAAHGYTLTYTAAAPLTSGSNTIPATTLCNTVTTTGGTSTSQFAMSEVVTGSGTPVNSYNHANATTTTLSGSSGTSGASCTGSGGTHPNWNFVSGTTTTLASATSAVSGDVVAMHYMANVSGLQAPGTYNLTITYLLTGNF